MPAGNRCSRCTPSTRLPRAGASAVRRRSSALLEVEHQRAADQNQIAVLDFAKLRADRRACAKRASAAQITHPKATVVRAQLELWPRNTGQHQTRTRVA